MNKLNKDLLFYSNYCLHSNNLINTISKTSLHNNMIYICIDEKKVKVPSFITRVPTVYLVKDKKILVEDDIDRWFEQKKNQQQYMQQQQQNMQQQMPNNMQQQMPNMQQQMPSNMQQQMPSNMQQQMPNNMQQQMPNNMQQQMPNNMQRQMPNMQKQMPNIQPPNRQMPNMQPPNRQMPNIQPPNRQMPNIQQQQNRQPPNQQKEEAPSGDEGILAYHGNEMGGSSMSNFYSFISDDNSSLNHNFEFLDGSNNDTRINTPKEFNDKNGGNQQKPKMESDFDKLLAERKNESFAKGIERI